VFDAIVVDTFKRVPIVCPPSDIQGNFGALVRPLFDQIDTLLTQNKLLVEARDDLLPKLMSGAIRV
jgi:type I restriction enzyme S subunit